MNILPNLLRSDFNSWETFLALTSFCLNDFIIVKTESESQTSYSFVSRKKLYHLISFEPKILQIFRRTSIYFAVLFQSIEDYWPLKRSNDCEPKSRQTSFLTMRHPRFGLTQRRNALLKSYTNAMLTFLFQLALCPVNVDRSWLRWRPDISVKQRKNKKLFFN